MKRNLLFLIIFILTSVATGYFALQLSHSIPQLPAGLLAADKGYGVTIDLTQYNNNALADTLATLRANGLTWVRQPIRWAEIETAPGQFDWEQIDRIFAAIAR